MLFLVRERARRPGRGYRGVGHEREAGGGGMMQEEFEERVGLKVTNKEYARIEEEYMASSVDKDIFCKEWLNKLTGAEYKAMSERVIKIELPPMTKGTLTTKNLMEAVFERVKKMPEFKRAEPIIDYMLADDFGSREITKYEYNFYAAINYPCTEGIYLDCWLSGKFDDSGEMKIGMGTVKTLENSQAAMMIMGELGGLLVWVEDKFVNQQISRGYFEQ
jgi:hypothetical protein